MTLAFTGGGTGGHIYPGLALIGLLRTLPHTRDARIIWLGAAAGLDKSIVEKAGLDILFLGIRSGKLRRYLSFKNITDIFNILTGYVQSVRILKREKPALLFSKGGFVSVPPAAAARTLRIPLWAHESDVSIGLANRINLRLASRLYVSYTQTAQKLAPALRAKCVYAGNPVRAAFFTASAARGRAFLGLSDDDPILLVLGGSQGAREINTLIESTLSFLTAHFVVVHQTGAEAEAHRESAPYTEFEKLTPARYKRYAYINNEMPDVLAAATLVVGRSGAGTVWECAACGKPMILIPLAGSGTRGDQVENARVFAAAGSALMLVHPAPHDLRAALDTLLSDSHKLAGMTATVAAHSAANSAAHNANRVNAAQKIAGDIAACVTEAEPSA